MRDDFSTLDICKALEIERERLRSWMKEDFIEPTIPAEGAGTRASFTRRDVYMVAVFKALLEKGQSRISATHLSNRLKKAWDDDYKGKISIDDILYILWQFKRKDKKLRYDFATFVRRHPHQPKGSEDERVWAITLYNSQPLTLNMKDGRLSEKDIRKYWEDDPSVMVDEGWEWLQILNFQNIKKEVDLALSELD